MSDTEPGARPTEAGLRPAGAAAARLSRRQARRQALFLLYQWDLTGLPLESLFEGSPDEFASTLARDVAADAPALDARISAASIDWPADRLGTLERNILRIGVHELEEGRGAGGGRDQRGGRAREALCDRGGGAARERNPRQHQAGGGMSAADESLQRAEELLERLRTRVDALEASADTGGDVDEAVDGLAEIAEIAREIESELQRARQAADAGA